MCSAMIGKQFAQKQTKWDALFIGMGVFIIKMLQLSIIAY
jgi:hypothetical protein